MKTALAYNLFSPNSLKNYDFQKTKGKVSLYELPLVRKVPCNLCHSTKFKLVFIVKSERQENFQVVKCEKCKLVQVNPQPNVTAVKPYYNQTYFTQRTKRGYNNYYSNALHKQIQDVFFQNLLDLDFFPYEENLFHRLKKTPRSMDAGCAAGYFVELLQNRGWQAEGVELAKSAIEQARNRKLKVHHGDFLSYERLKPRSYDLLSFWASIEHMQDPFAVFKQSYRLLKTDGRLFLSTCRYGILAKLLNEKWRFMNVPEHLYFFSLDQILKMAQKANFALVSSITYGSGLTSKQSMSWGYQWGKRCLDFLVKRYNQGDMMALHFRKVKKPS